MIAYTIKRLLLAVPLLIAVLLVSFLMLWALPGDPTHALLGRHWTPEAAEAVKIREGLDKPIPEQFTTYLSGVAKGDLGRSTASGVPVLEELKRRIPATIELSL
ncbi:MAG: ABC transporter permease, partial [Planctomycetes bacterium]|nr:ABC transporter permease [Planctomycetota bacterium]